MACLSRIDNVRKFGLESSALPKIHLRLVELCKITNVK